MQSAKEIRKSFLDFFEEKGHKIVSSAPLVVKNDPTLMFINAGMNPFKDIFLGYGKIESPRVADTQKCLRVSGKHNDLDEVGYDTYHHTLFEMLGNWSFGDYFKEEAINWAWELLTDVYKLDKDRLYATVFEGDKADGTKFDQEAFDFWKKHLPEDRIINGNKKDNFWEMGDVGPCGPCSELHIDLRPDAERKEISGRDLVNEDHPQVIEIWNLVFMQFNRKADGSLEDLPSKHVDTGMGFERLVRAIQKKTSNYDTDVFLPILDKIESLTGFVYGKEEKIDIAMRVVADHCRAIIFSIADGQLPSNNGAGYVIRRILRRASRYGYTYLNQSEGFIYQLVDVLVKEMGEFFPELTKQKDLITKVIQEEEGTFLKNLAKGISLLENEMKNTKGKQISGKQAFVLYDTYGFPIDLTELIAAEAGFTIDLEEYKKERKAQQDRGRKATSMTTEDWVTVQESDDEYFFSGYDQLEDEVKILSYRKVVQNKKEIFQLLVNRSPFYAEGGGQVGDKGKLVSEEEELPIFDTKKENNQIVLYTNKEPKNPNIVFKAIVHADKRQSTACNHSATHLLHYALREVLGKHVEQKGSLVNSDNLRFDFSHFSKVTPEEIVEIETMVNNLVLQGLPLQEERETTIDEAKAKGAMALFGEKYGDKVRTIQFGNSIELCGGIHVQNTSDIFMFKITMETSVAAGIRRIEAITQRKALDFLNKEKSLLDGLRAELKNPKDILKTLQQNNAELSALRKEVESLKREKAQQLEKSLESSVNELNGMNVFAGIVPLDAGSLKSIAFSMERKFDNFIGLFASKEGGKPTLTIIINKDLAVAKDLNAGKMVRDLGKFIQGGGGGQAHFATAGGKKVDGLQEAVNTFVNIISQ
jgi:alanyl-tRNA synthetase